MTFCKLKYKYLVKITLFIVLFLSVFKLVSLKREGGVEENKELTFSQKSGFYDESFELELTAKSGIIYYTLDGSLPDKNAIKYEKPILITDATENENVYSMRTDVSVGFEREEIEKISSDYPGYQVPNYKVDKATVVRAVVYDGIGHYGNVKSETYFVGYSDKNGYEGMKILNIITDPSNLFDYETGIYVTGKTYDEYIKEYRNTGEYYWREEFWALWLANYRNRGIKWERKALCQFFDESGQIFFEQVCGIRTHGGVSRGYSQKSLNIYAREEYDGNKKMLGDLFGTGYYASAVTLFQGGNDIRTKAKDFLVCNAIKDLNVSTMSYEPYVMFLDGEYWGIYWLNEKYNVDYLAHKYNVNKDNVILIKNGDLEDGDEEDYQYFSKMFEFCTQSDVTVDENYNKVCELIDIESYIDYYATMIYIGRYGDWPWLNYALWRVKKSEAGSFGDQKWRWMIFDLNSPGFSADMDSIQYVIEHDDMFRNLMTNISFREQLVSRIEQLMDTIFDPETMDKAIEEYRKFMTEPIRENDKRFFGEDSLDTFNKEMEMLKYFFSERKMYLQPILDSYK